MICPTNLHADSEGSFWIATAYKTVNTDTVFPVQKRWWIVVTIDTKNVTCLLKFTRLYQLRLKTAFAQIPGCITVCKKPNRKLNIALKTWPGHFSHQMPL